MLARQWSTIFALSLSTLTLASAEAVEFVVSDNGQTKLVGPEQLGTTPVQTVDVTVPVQSPATPAEMNVLAPPQTTNGYPDLSIPSEPSLAAPDLPDVTVPVESPAIRDPASPLGSLESQENQCLSCGQTLEDGSCSCGLPSDLTAAGGCAGNCLTDGTSVDFGAAMDGCCGGCSAGGACCGCGTSGLAGLGTTCGCGPGSSCLGGCGGGCGGCKGSWFLNMWVAAGYTYNARDPASGSNLPLTFNDRADEFLMNQLYVSFGKAVSTCTWDFGGRIDLLYGTDYFFTEAFGLEKRQDGRPHWNSSDGPRGTGAARYGLALPQAYAEFGIPIGAGTSVAVGHFYTIIGYESVMAPENFFYSQSFMRQYGEPFTHSGVLIDQAITESMNVLFGVTTGWNNWDNLNDKAAYLAGISWCPTARSSLAFSMYSGREDPQGINNRTLYSLVYTRQLSNRWQYVFQHDFGTQANAEIDAEGNLDSAKWYGINQYLYYQASPCLTWGARIDWFRDQDNARVLGIPSERLADGGNYVGLSLGANYRPACKWIFRPEIRWDWSDTEAPALDINGMFDDFNKDNQFTIAGDFIFRF